MLSRENRLTRKKDFEKVFKKGRWFRYNFLDIKFTENNLNTSRFGLIVGTKISKRAVIRNSIKRRLRELIKTNLSSIKKGVDVVVIVRPGFQTKNFRDLGTILRKLFKKARLLP